VGVQGAEGVRLLGNHTGEASELRLAPHAAQTCVAFLRTATPPYQGAGNRVRGGLDCLCALRLRGGRPAPS